MLSPSPLNVYSTPVNMTGTIDFICSIYMCIYPLYMPSINPNLVGIFGSGTYLAITYEVDI